MDWTRLKNIGLNRIAVVMALSLGLTVVGKMSLDSSRSYQRLNLIQEGLQTCFNRAQQSFTARMIADLKSPYLAADFQDNTSRCFGETVEVAETHFTDVLKDVPTLVNTLATEVHILHDRLSTKTSAFSQGSDSGLDTAGKQFSKVERTRDQVLGQLERHNQNLADTISTLRGAFYVISLSLLIFLVFEWSLQRKENQIKQEIEDEARDLIEAQDFNALRVEGVIRRALEHKDYLHCESLFTQFQHIQTQKAKEGSYFTPVEEDVLPEALERRFDEVWEAADRPERNLVVYDESFTQERSEPQVTTQRAPSMLTREGVELSEVVEQLVEHLGDQIFGHGVALELDIEENLKLKGSQEEIAQFLYQSLNFLTGDSNQCSCLTMTTRQLGNVVVLNAELDGLGFSQDLVAGQIGYKPLNDESLPFDLRVAKEVGDVMGAKLSFDNLYDDRGNPAGRTLKLTFRMGDVVDTTARGPRLKDLRKGTKRELMRSFEESRKDA